MKLKSMILGTLVGLFVLHVAIALVPNESLNFPVGVSGRTESNKERFDCRYGNV